MPCMQYMHIRMPPIQCSTEDLVAFFSAFRRSMYLQQRRDANVAEEDEAPTRHGVWGRQQRHGAARGMAGSKDAK